ncbi:MAG: hydratase [Aerococcus urinaeequi]
MMDQEIIHASKTLYQADNEKVPVQYGKFGIVNEEDGYRVQQAVLDLRKEAGEKVAGYKISLSAKIQQSFFKTTTPLYGVMTDKGVWGSDMDLSKFMGPLLEFEIIFKAEERISSDDSVETIMSKCKVATGYEIPDCRYDDWYGNISKFELIADGAANAGVVAGEYVKRTYQEIDDVMGTVTVDGRPYTQGSSKEVMGHPAYSVQWLAQKLAETGKAIEPGMFVASGAVNMPKVIKPGVYVGQFEGLPPVTLNAK